MRFSPSPKSAINAWIVPCLLIALAMLASRPAWAQVSATLSGSTSFRPNTPLEVQNATATPVGHYSGPMLRLTLGLQPPHIAEERQFLEDLQNPHKGSFHQFLSAAEWTQRFDPSAADEQAVVDWATANGLTVAQRFPNRLIVDVVGSVATIEKALNVTINSYQLGSNTGFSNDRDPEIPSNLTGILHSIGGLQNLHVAHPMNKNAKEPVFPDFAPGPAASQAATGSHDADRSKLPAALKAKFSNSSKKSSSGVSHNYTSGPPYDPEDMFNSNAYDAYALYGEGHCCNPTNNSGGTPPETSIAIATAGSQNGSDFSGWFSTYGYLAGHWFFINIDGSPACCDGEGTMDFEWSTAMSNSFGSYLDTASVYMYDGVNPGFGTFNDIYNTMLSNGYARNFSTSWGCEELACYDSGDMNTANSIFASMIGQGWSLTAASGDQGASAGCGDATAVQFPSSDPNIVAAGGTTMYLNPAFLGFTAWSGGPDGCGSNDGGSTGGYSSYWGTPSFQSGFPSRGVPDIALNADWYNTPQYLYFGGGLSGNGGTSIVAPETVGFFAQANAYLLALGNICGAGSSPCSPLGAVNPLLYEAGANGVPHNPFYDITTGCNNNDVTAFYGLGYYCAGAGWDAVTGWGSYNFLQLAWAINWLHVPGYTYPVVNFSGPTTGRWYNTDQEVTWTVSAPSQNSFPSDGVAGFTQQWDGDPGNPTSEATPGQGNSFYSGPQYANATSGCLDITGAFCANSVFGAQGLHTVNVRAWGNEGENGGDYTYGPIGYDTVAPVTTGSVSGSVNTAIVTLSASDPGYPSTGSGVANTTYQLDGGAVTTYTGPFGVSTVGPHTVTFHSTDNAGNVEGTESVSFSVTSTTSTTLTSSLNPAAKGKIVDFTAVISHPAAGTLTGTVTFKDGATVLATKTVASGKAVLAISTLALGSHNMTATYNGATYFQASVSSILVEKIESTSTTALASSKNPSEFGQSVTFTATITPSAATGTVTFKNGAVVLGTGAVSGGKATFSTSTLTVSTVGHLITAVYSGDSNYVGSTSPSLKQIVNKVNTSTTVASSLNPSTSGQTVTFTATVTASVGTATGLVDFYDGATKIGAKALTSGNAAFSTSKLATGSHSIKAVYVGGPDFNTSSSAILTQVVNP